MCGLFLNPITFNRIVREKPQIRINFNHKNSVKSHFKTHNNCYFRMKLYLLPMETSSNKLHLHLQRSHQTRLHFKIQLLLIHVFSIYTSVYITMNDLDFLLNLLASPPNDLIFCWIHLKTMTWSFNPKLPGQSSCSVLRKPSGPSRKLAAT